MGRYKGQRSKATLLREFPHQVRFVVPGIGFGMALNDLQAWCLGARACRAADTTGPEDRSLGLPVG
jgi:hypothetical protein